MQRELMHIALTTTNQFSKAFWTRLETRSQKPLRCYRLAPMYPVLSPIYAFMANFLRPQSWEDQYSKRLTDKHKGERNQLEYQDHDTRSLIAAVFNHKHKSEYLEPPKLLTHLALNEFLRCGDLKWLPCQPPAEDTENVVLLDDRRNLSEQAPSLRLGEKDNPQGEIGHSKALSIKEYYNKIRHEKVRLTLNCSTYCLLSVELGLTGATLFSPGMKKAQMLRSETCKFTCGNAATLSS